VESSQSRVVVAKDGGQFGKPEEEEHPPLKTVTRRLVKIVTENTRERECACVRACVRVCVCARVRVCVRARV
jgi:hypothetical protein